MEVRFPTSATAQAPQGAAAPDAAGVREPAVSDTSRPDEEVETQVKVSTGATEDSGRVLSVSTGQPDPVSTPSGPADVDSLTADVWWQTTTPHSGSEAEDPAERRVLKLKASKPQEKDTPRPTQPVSEVPPQAWWIPESETDLTAMPEGPIAGQAVLKMKAEQPPVQDPANQPAAPDKPLPHADDEDWWSPSTKIEEDLDA